MKEYKLIRTKKLNYYDKIDILPDIDFELNLYAEQGYIVSKMLLKNVSSTREFFYILLERDIPE